MVHTIYTITVDNTIIGSFKSLKRAKKSTKILFKGDCEIHVVPLPKGYRLVKDKS